MEIIVKNMLTGFVIFAAGLACGIGVSQVFAQQEPAIERWELSHTPTGATRIGNPAYYILRFNRESGDVWVSEDGKDFKLIKVKD